MTAPIAQIEDDWTNFSEFPSVLQPSALSIDTNGNEPSDWNLDMKLDNNCNDVKTYQSMEDLVHRFEENVAATFKFSSTPCNGDKASEFKPLREYSEILVGNEVWKHIIDDYGLVQPLEWVSSRFRKLQLSSLGLKKQPESIEDECRDSSELDNLELRRQLDLHRLTDCDLHTDYMYNISGTNGEVLQNENVQTADEVIQELEEIMSDAVEQDAAFDDELQQQTGIIISDNVSLGADTDDGFGGDDGSLVCDTRDLASPSSQDESDRATSLKHMTSAELEEELRSLEETVKLYSENLLNQLNLRDELLYRNEIQNAFISKALEVQYKQEQFQRNNKVNEDRFKVPKLPRSFSMSSASAPAAPGRFLTTVIPSGDGVPSLEGLQALIKLLDAIKEDSDEVPSLITNYILKFLCPSTSLHTLNL